MVQDVHICEIYAVKHVQSVEERVTYLVFCLQMSRISRDLLVRCAKGAELASFAVHFWSSLDSLLGSWSWVRIQQILRNSQELWVNCAKSG